MPTCEEVADSIGQRTLWCGADAYSWNIPQFISAAQFARSHGLSSLFVKVGEAGVWWYGGLTGVQNVGNAVHSQGVGVIPYIYSDGGGYLAAEIAQLQTLIRTFGVVCIDLEKEWSGELGWGTSICNAMKSEKGIFLVSTFGNPDQQGLKAVLQALNPCVDAYMPQQYSNYLATTWTQFAHDGAACLIPTIDLSQEFAPNDPVAVTRAAYTEGHKGISFWYYGFAVQAPTVLSNVLAAFPERAIPTPSQGATTVTQQSIPTPAMTKAAEDQWNSTAHLFGGTPPRYDSGIAKAWQWALFNLHAFGPPLTQEYPSVDWGGAEIVCQEFARGRVEWKNGAATWYGANGQIAV